MKDKNIFTVLEALGETIREKELQIFLLNNEIKSLREKIEEAEQGKKGDAE